jgi:pSer/pThr/pTyr-binding forkhead associated (FHA) protein
MGVSRRHASLALENNKLNLWDLGSSNGTFINGTRLTPHQPSPLRDGDEVRLGQMVLRLFFQKNAKSNGESS